MWNEMGWHKKSCHEMSRHIKVYTWDDMAHKVVTSDVMAHKVVTWNVTTYKVVTSVTTAQRSCQTHSMDCHDVKSRAKTW